MSEPNEPTVLQQLLEDAAKAEREAQFQSWMRLEQTQALKRSLDAAEARVKELREQIKSLGGEPCA